MMKTKQKQAGGPRNDYCPRKTKKRKGPWSPQMPSSINLFSSPFRPAEAEPSSPHLPCCPRRRAEAGGGGAATISAVIHPGYDPRQGIYSLRPPSPTQPLSLAADSQTPHSP